MIRNAEYTHGRLLQTSQRRDQAHALAYRRAELGERFGSHWATYWFRATAIVPQEWAGRRIDRFGHDTGFAPAARVGKHRVGELVCPMSASGSGRVSRWSGSMSPRVAVDRSVVVELEPVPRRRQRLSAARALEEADDRPVGRELCPDVLVLEHEVVDRDCALRLDHCAEAVRRRLDDV